MSIFDTINAHLKEAMRAQDKVRLQALRNIRAGFIEKMKEANLTTLEDPVCLEVLRHLAKQHGESIESYVTGHRDDLVAQERAQLAIVESYLPRLADDATTRAWIDQAIAATGATSAREMGKVMGTLMKAHKAELDGNLANRIVREKLGA